MFSTFGPRSEYPTLATFNSVTNGGDGGCGGRIMVGVVFASNALCIEEGSRASFSW